MPVSGADSPSLNIVIVGASGYTGAELASILAGHPHIKKITYLSRSLAGQEVAVRFPVLRGRVRESFAAPTAAALAAGDAVFFATPPAVAMNEAAAIIAGGGTVIDLSPDFRLRDAAIFEQWYGRHAAPQLLAQAVYGLTEAARPQLKGAALIACPGCFATAIELALIPLVAADLIKGQVVIDAKSGISGAGRRADRADLLFAEHAENFKAYAVEGHRHQPEIIQTLAAIGAAPPMVFVPHLLPVTRGIYASMYVPVRPGAEVAAALREHWADELFIDVVEDLPQLAQVARSNRIQLFARRINEDTALLIAALDNLQKGAAGQAVQNMNVCFGLPESAGLVGARNG